MTPRHCGNEARRGRGYQLVNGHRHRAKALFDETTNHIAVVRRQRMAIARYASGNSIASYMAV